eukprot:CAMPEP_0113822312 /NCGR_PEP_ID=MMETSP0328-20130328/2178_1 /TAXON_ID=39455 /ORGANISM="Alexandrium minutum" /LENGTH=139 /DNA_ID=CAMNT_0000790249 /DNA_START=23 /DNA_END=442 /DNA_ORIENTATION=+ /assembly_acc=CAM_ASM_000350
MSGEIHMTSSGKTTQPARHNRSKQSSSLSVRSRSSAVAVAESCSTSASVPSSSPAALTGSRTCSWDAVDWHVFVAPSCSAIVQDELDSILFRACFPTKAWVPLFRPFKLSWMGICAASTAARNVLYCCPSGLKKVFDRG